MLKRKKSIYRKADLQNQRILDTPEVIAYTGLSKSTIDKLNAARLLPNGKSHGTKIFYSREEIDHWLLSNGTKGLAKRNAEASTFLSSQKRRNNNQSRAAHSKNDFTTNGRCGDRGEILAARNR